MNWITFMIAYLWISLILKMKVFYLHLSKYIFNTLWCAAQMTRSAALFEKNTYTCIFKEALTNRATIAWPINLATISQDLPWALLPRSAFRVHQTSWFSYLMIFVIFCTANHPQLMRQKEIQTKLHLKDLAVTEGQACAVGQAAYCWEIIKDHK